MDRRDRPSAAALTLIEMLVAMLLTSTVLLLSRAVLVSTLDVHAASRRAARGDQARSAWFDLLAVDLAGAVLREPANERPADTSWLVETDPMGDGIRALEFPTVRSLLSFSEPAEIGPIRVRYELSGAGVGDGLDAVGGLVERTAYAQGRILPARTVARGVSRAELQVLQRGQWVTLRAPTILDAAPAALRLVVHWADASQPCGRRTFLIGGLEQ
jgi:type II secretory pathway component PulJ